MPCKSAPFYDPSLDGLLVSSKELYAMQTDCFDMVSPDRIESCLALQDQCYWHIRAPFVGLASTTHTYHQLAHQFSLWELAPRRGRGVHVALIDTTLGTHPDLPMQVQSHELSPIAYCSLGAHHATHLAGIMAARPSWLTSSLRVCGPLIGAVGIAPEMTLIGITALKNDGIGDKKSVAEALCKAYSERPRIINISLRAKQLVCDMQPPFPFMVVPFTSGLIVPSKQNRFSSVILETGALTFNGTGRYKKYTDSTAFLLPGTHIMSTAVPYNFSEYIYLFMSGHSQATACMSGFLALVLSEFDYFLCDADFKKVFFYCVSQEGIFDMRLCLFILHTLRCYYYLGSFDQTRLPKIVSTLLSLLYMYGKNTPLDYEPVHIRYIMPSLYFYSLYSHLFLFAKFLLNCSAF